MWTYVPCELCTTMATDEELVPHLQNLCRRGEVVVVIMPHPTLALWDDYKMIRLHCVSSSSPNALFLHHLSLLYITFFFLLLTHKIRWQFPFSTCIKPQLLIWTWNIFCSLYQSFFFLVLPSSYQLLHKYKYVIFSIGLFCNNVFFFS